MYFQSGLTKEELKAEYKKLAKKYHPDISKDPNATKIMQDINSEFDEYFVRCNITSFTTTSQYNPYKDVYNAYTDYYQRKEAEKWRNKIFYIIRNKFAGEHAKSSWCICKEDSMFNPIYVKSIDGSELHSGFVVSDSYDKDEDVLKVRMADVHLVTDPCVCFDDNSLRSLSSTSIYQSPIGEILVSNYCTFVEYDNKIHEVRLPKGLIKNSKFLGMVDYTDVICRKYQECTLEEFENTHDVNWYPSMLTDTTKIDRYSWENSVMSITAPVIINHMVRKGYINVY